LGWTLFVLVHVFDSYVLPRRLSPHRGQVETALTAVVSIGLAIVLFVQHCPLIYYAYAGFPVFFWEEVLANRETLKEGIKVLMEGDGKKISSINITSQSLLYIGILESLVIFLLPLFV
jgi:phosphatidylinositol glycan class N